MAYATAQDLVDRFGGEEMGALAPGEIEGDGSEDSPYMAKASTPTLTAALEDVSAEVDAKLARAYALPLSGGPYRLLVKAAADLARARLYQEQIPDRVASRAKTIMEVLGTLASGQVELVAADGSVVARRPTARFVGREREFTVGSRVTGGELKGLDLY